jgi:succinate dehydrogenase/fumarate reductase cytochrome b subunit
MQADRITGTVGAISGRYPQRTLGVAMIVFIALQCLDLLTTWAAFSKGGIELNPVVSSLMPWTGKVLAVFASKAILISLMFLLARRKRILYIGNILYSAIVAWNVAIVFALT